MEVIFMINKSFYLGFILAIALFFPYIFSTDNLYEKITPIFAYDGYLKVTHKHHYLYHH